MSQNYKIDVGSTSKTMSDREKKRRKTEIQKFEYLENEKSFLDEIKSIFYSFLRAFIWLKIKNWWKIADTSFKYFLILSKNQIRNPVSQLLQISSKMMMAS